MPTDDMSSPADSLAPPLSTSSRVSDRCETLASSSASKPATMAALTLPSDARALSASDMVLEEDVGAFFFLLDGEDSGSAIHSSASSIEKCDEATGLTSLFAIEALRARSASFSSKVSPAAGPCPPVADTSSSSGAGSALFLASVRRNDCSASARMRSRTMSLPRARYSCLKADVSMVPVEAT